ncbi:thiamine diphosphokinase [Streptococcus ferus]|uniref:thiamine diphosphokinase n=1 Tax=Streptococcus ferus TaxID=1345 RepID=UPI0035A03FE9
MLRVGLFSGGDLTFFTETFDYYVGVDRGSLFLLEQGLPLDLAVGDFDSVTADELSDIKKAAGQIYQSPSEKNDTDTELALKWIFQQFEDAEVTVFGALGGRADHSLSNIFLPSDPELAPFMERIVLRDQQNVVHYFPAGRHQISQEKDSSYISFMPEGAADLEIRGAKYELTASHFFKKKIYSSNEFIGQPIEFSVSQGYLIVIQTKDKD